MTLGLQGITITGTYHQYQAAVVVGEGMPVAIDNCVFLGNTAETSAGAIDSEAGRPLITNCLFFDNSGDKGGAIDASYGDLEMERCTFAGNSAIEGGALYVKYPYDVALSNCTFAFNGAAQGGAISLLGRDTLSYVAVTANIVAFSEEGEGIYWDGVGPIDLVQNDIYGNAGGDWVGSIAGQLGLNGNVGIDPLFCDAGNGDFTLMDASYCLPENNPDNVLIGAHGQGCATPTIVSDEIRRLPERNLLSNRPNPFNPRTTITFHLLNEGRVTIGLYDIAGRLIVPLTERRYGPGTQTVDWDGKDALGRPVSSGTYIVLLRSAGRTETRKISLLR